MRIIVMLVMGTALGCAKGAPVAEPTIENRVEDASAAASWSGLNPFGRPAIETVRTENGWRVTVTMAHKDGAVIPAGPVPFTAELYTLSVAPADSIAEDDILDTGAQVDLDGDGTWRGDSVAMACGADGSVTIAGRTLRPLLTEGDNPMRYPEPLDRQLVLYRPCTEDSLVLGIQGSSKRLALETTGGPVLQILAYERTGHLRSGSMSAGQMSHRATVFNTREYDTVFGEPDWISVVWFMAPIDPDADTTEVTFELAAEGEAPRMILAIPNVSDEPRARWQFDSAAAVLPL